MVGTMIRQHLYGRLFCFTRLCGAGHRCFVLVRTRLGRRSRLQQTASTGFQYVSTGQDLVRTHYQRRHSKCGIFVQPSLRRHRTYSRFGLFHGRPPGLDAGGRQRQSQRRCCRLLDEHYRTPNDTGQQPKQGRQCLFNVAARNQELPGLSPRSLHRLPQAHVFHQRQPR